jgi:uncharacterized protein YbjT (DUF2867 family)
MNLIAGATGTLGSEICRRLAAKGKPVRALVRTTSDPETVEALRNCGAEIVQGDLCNRASLDAACNGATAVISTVSSMPSRYVPGENDIECVDVAGLTSLIEAAQAAGVQHFVYTSFSGNLDLDYPLRNAKRMVEQRLKESGITYTVLRPSYFMESWFSPMVGFDAANATAQIYGTGARTPSVGSLMPMSPSLPWRAWTTRRRATPRSRWAARRPSAPWRQSGSLRRWADGRSRCSTFRWRFWRRSKKRRRIRCNNRSPV